MSRTLLAIAISVALSLALTVSPATAAELTAAAVSDPKGDGPDGKGNTADDTWQFWFQLLHGPQCHRLDLCTTTMPADQRQNGITDHKARRGKRKVQGPIAGMLPNAADSEGWIYRSDWDGRYEGAWGDKKANQVILHPYNEKVDGGAVAITYKVPNDGKYNISGKLTDMQANKSGHAMINGIIYVVDVVDGGADSITAAGKELKRDKMGDNAGPESAEFKIEAVELKKGQLVRLSVDPNKVWATDMTRVDSFKIEPAK